MRKLSLLLVVLLAAGSAGLYGQMAINTDFSITGDATATLGYDLDHQKFGFKNEFNSNISLELVPKQSSKKPGEDDEMPTGWYGMIELKDFRIIIDNEYDDDDADKKKEVGSYGESVASKATAGQNQLGVGYVPVPGVAGDGSVQHALWMHNHDDSPLIVTTSDGDLDDDSTFNSSVLSATGPPIVFVKLNHIHAAPTLVEPSQTTPNPWLYAPEDSTDTMDVNENLVGAGQIRDANETCDTDCVIKGGWNMARTGEVKVSGDTNVLVPAHYHTITALSDDSDTQTFDSFTISDAVGAAGGTLEIRQALPADHTHNNDVHSHVTHTHAGHTHAAQAHDKHSHYGNVTVTNPSVTAKLINGPLSIKIHSAPGNVAGLIGPVEDNKPAPDDGKADKVGKSESAESNDGATDVHVDLGGQGITLGYDTDDLSIAVGISSDVTYDAKTYGGFVVSGDVAVDIGPAKVELEVVQAIQSTDGDNNTVGRNLTGFSGKITGELGSLTLSAGADFLMTGESDPTGPINAANAQKKAVTTAPGPTLRSSQSAPYPYTQTSPCKYDAAMKGFTCPAPSTPPPPTAPEDEALEWEFGAGLDFALGDTTKLSAKYIYSTRETVGSDLWVELSDDKSIVENLKWSLAWGLFDLANGWAESPKLNQNDKSDMMVKGDVSYAFEAMGGKLTPGVIVSLNRLDNQSADVTTEVKLVLTEAIPLTEFGVKWKSESLFEPEDDDPNNDLGVLTAWTKVKY